MNARGLRRARAALPVIPVHRRTLHFVTVVTVVVALAAFTAVPVVPGERPSELRADLPEARAGLAEALVRARAADPVERRAASRILGVLGGRRAVVQLERLTHDAVPAVADEAALALARARGDAGAAAAQLAVGCDVLDVTDAVSACGGDAAVRTLLRLAETGDPYVRGGAIRVLARVAPAEAVPAIGSALVSGDEPLRLAALEACLDAPDAALTHTLRHAASSLDRVERRLADAALARAGDGFAERRLLGAVDEARADGDAWAEVLATEALLRASSRNGPRLWLRALQTLSVPDRALAVGRLRDTAARAVAPVLRGLLRDASPDLRVAAALVLARAGDPSAEPVLRRDGRLCGRDTALACEVALLGTVASR